MSHGISESLLETFTLIWDMYADAINGISDDHWRSGEIDYLIPARLMLHAIETTDFYSSPTPKEFRPLHNFKVDRKTASSDQLPNKAQMMHYYEEVKAKTMSWLKSMEDTELLSPESEFPWTGSTVLGRVLYLLAHCRQHFGELNAELRRRGLPRIKWKTF